MTTSNESTTTASKPRANAKDNSFFPPRKADAASRSAAVLESQLQEEKAERRIERFFWIFGLTVLSDVLIYKILDSNFIFILFFSLELAGLIALANWLEVPWIVRPLEALFNRYLGQTTAPKEEEPKPPHRPPAPPARIPAPEPSEPASEVGEGSPSDESDSPDRSAQAL